MVISEVRIHYCTVMTTPIYSTTRSVSNVMLKYRIGNITIGSTLIPINSTTISTCIIVLKDTPIKFNIVTAFSSTRLQEYSTTTFSSSIINKNRIKNITNSTSPNNSTTITTKSNITLRSSTISNT